MEFGALLAKVRKARKMTQAKLAEKIGVSTEAVSAWERGAYRPDEVNMEALEDVLHLSYYDDEGEERNVKIFGINNMSSFLHGRLSSGNFPEAFKALGYATEKHKDSKPRKGPGRVPYIIHPLTMTCHALAMGLEDDVLLASLLLHDVSEDCGIAPEDLPFSEEVRHVVKLVTKPKVKKDYSPEKYFGAIEQDPKACMVKCIDRCNNLSGMANGFSAGKMREYIRETRKWYPPLLRVIKRQPEYSNAAWLLKYMMESLLETAERI